MKDGGIFGKASLREGSWQDMFADAVTKPRMDRDWQPQDGLSWTGEPSPSEPPAPRVFSVDRQLPI